MTAVAAVNRIDGAIGFAVVAITDQTAIHLCPPHRWLIESRYQTGGALETWTCAQCGEVQHRDRRALDAQPKHFTAGSGKPPSPEPEGIDGTISR